MRCSTRAAVLACLAPAAVAGELQCFGRTADVEASVACFDPADVRLVGTDVRFARLYLADGRAALRRQAALLVDCPGRRAFEVDHTRLDDAEFGPVAVAVCAARGRGRR